MAASENFPLSFNGIASGGGKIYFSAMFDNKDVGGIYSYEKGHWKGFQLKVPIQGVCYLKTPLVLSPNSQVGRFKAGKMKYSLIGNETKSRFHGPPSAICVLSKKIYVVGMDMIYSSSDGIEWEQVGAEANGFESVHVAFRSVCSNSSKLIFVGHDGGIVSYSDHWHIYDSPTNVILNKVVCLGGDVTLAVGKKGTILKILKNQCVEVVHTDISDEIWDVILFRGDIILCTSSQLFKLSSGVATKIKTSGIPMASNSNNFGQLFVGDDCLWVVGPKLIAYSNDLLSWNELNYDLPKI